MFNKNQDPATKTKLLSKRIPTFIGLFVLVGALIAGTLLIGEGGGVFAPRATPQTTPKNIEVTNVTDTGFTISFLTDESTSGLVKYGTEPNSLKSVAGEDRNQLQGKVGSYQTHYMTVSGLQPNTTYYYTLGTASGTFDNDGQPYSLKTTARNGAPAAARTIYGSVSNEAGNPAEGAIVYITLKNAGKMSSQVKSSGSWAVPLSNARTLDGSAYAQITDADIVLITVQGLTPGQIINQETTVGAAQPVPTIALTNNGGGNHIAMNDSEASKSAEKVASDEAQILPPEFAPSSTESAEPNLDLELDEQVDLLDSLSEITDQSATKAAASTESATTETVTVLNLDDPTPQVMNTAQPKIVGKAAPNVKINISVHSDTQIEQTITADVDGSFELDIAELSKDLEPGEHTVTYSYIDPATGQEIEKTVTFMVAPKTATTGQQVAMGTSPTPTPSPFGTGNPFPPTMAPATQSASPSATPAPATDSGRVVLPATNEAIPVSGSVGSTLALVFGGLFFITSGAWSLWISNQLSKEDA